MLTQEELMDFSSNLAKFLTIKTENSLAKGILQESRASKLQSARETYRDVFTKIKLHQARYEEIIDHILSISQYKNT